MSRTWAEGSGWGHVWSDVADGALPPSTWGFVAELAQQVRVRQGEKGELEAEGGARKILEATAEACVVSV